MILIGILALVGGNCNLWAAEKAESDQVLGEKIVRQLWADVKAADVEALEKLMASGYFQI